jgi:hypothetical protein
MAIDAERLYPAVGENEVKFPVVEGGVGGVDDGVLIVAKEGEEGL